MKNALLFCFSFLTLGTFAQDPSIDAGPDASVCPPECVDATATYVGGGGNTSDYETSVIPYAPDPYAGTLVSLWDDDVTDAIPIGFDFCFYGNTYSEFYIGSNGWVSFSPGEPTTFTSSPIPSADPDVPKNCIMGPWYDIDPGAGGEVRYQMLGVEPSRRMVVSYINVPHFLCDDQIETYQIIFYETTNNIENHIQQKAACLDWDDGFAVQGLHNIDGSEAVPFPGRNNTVWEVTDDAVRYTPLGEPDVEWFDEAGVSIGVGTDITLCPDVPTTYTVRLYSCGVEIASDEIFVDVVCCEPPTMSKTDVTCFGGCDGTATAEPFGVPPFTFLWDDPGAQTTATAVGLCAGTYTVTVSDSEDCVEEATITIDEPEELTATFDIEHVSCFGADDGSIVVTATGGTAPLTYDIGAGPAITGTFTGLATGSYTVTIIDDNGCAISQDIDITDSPLPNVVFEADTLFGCEPLEVVFTSTGDDGVSCEWLFGDGSSSTTCGSVTHTYDAGTFDVMLTVTNIGGCSSSALYNDFIDVYEVPDASFIFSPNNVTTLDTEVDFTDFSTGADAWTWTFDAYGNSNDQNPTFVFPQEEGDYETTLLVTTNDGCSDSITKIVRVNQQQLIFVPNVITPDGDSFNEVFLPYFTGIDIYDYHLIIYNRWGEIMFESYDVTKGWSGTYGGEIVPDGTYIWQIVTADIASDAKLEFYGHVTVVK